MNTLIIGGLLALALVAILGVILLARSEAKASTTPEASLPPSAQKPTNGLSTQQIVEDHASDDEPGAEIMLPAINGQLREFTNELRSLHQQAWELEKRLGILTQMMDRMEQATTSHVSIEEEMLPSLDSTSSFKE